MHVVDGVEMVDVREAARLASRSPETIRRWVWSGKVHAVKDGTKLLIPRREVELQAVPEGGESRSTMTLAEWIAVRDERVARRPAATPGASARDILLEERYERGYGAGS
ncbi:MAG: helix-turn-helix domain-containing protein [Nocardioidaceae bacterium]|nr:helix-turn-helix domain-containing protein [Nocardioidaceae bacterium]